MRRAPGRSLISRGSRLAAVMFVICATPAPRLAAQATTVTLEGLVVATGGGGVLQGARVSARSRESGAAREALTDRRGAYRIVGLAPGLYDVTARAVGCRPERRDAVQLIIGERATVDFVLTRSAVALEPVVVSAGQAPNGQRTDVSTVVGTEEVDRLPLNTRNLLNLAAVAPGIRTFAPEGGRSIPSAGPLPSPRFTNLYVDGVEWKGMTIGNVVGQPQTGSLVPQEAVQEFRVYLNPYDVEYTRGASWVISAVTRRGGNRLEGSIFDFYQDRALVAKGSFQATKPEYRREQLGGSLRGPILRNRVFFAASYEGQLTDNFVDVVPGGPAGNPGIWDRYAGTFKAPYRNQAGLLRLTALAGAHTLDATWAARRLTSEANFGIAVNNVQIAHEGGVRSDYTTNSVQLRDTYASSSVVNELTLHALRSDQDDSPLVPGPGLVYVGIQTGRANFPVSIAERHFTLSDKVSYVPAGLAGKHQFKGGFEMTRIRGSLWQPTTSYGIFRFESDTSTQPLSGQIGVGFLDPTSTRDARAPMTGWLAGGYVQDQWRPVPVFTITAGVRYDAEINTLEQRHPSRWAADTVLQRVVGGWYLNTGDRENDLNNFAPRVALTWDANGTGRTVMRAGYGVMYDRVPVIGALSEQISWRWRTYIFARPGTTDPQELRRRVATGGGVSTPNVVLLPDRMETPANHQWSIGAARRLSDHLALDVDYVSQHVANVPVTVRANTLDSATGQRRLTGRYGDIILWGSFGDATFRALLLSLTYERRPARVSAAYTLGWARSEFGALSTSDFPDSASYSMQRSEGDERHRAVLSGFTELPFRVELSAIVVAASPRPFLVIVGTDVNKNGIKDDDWPDGNRTWRRGGWSNWYRTADFRLGRSFARAPGRMRVTAEAFNLFNWANHSEYRGALKQAGFAEPSGDYARRQVQIGLRYQF